MKKTASEILHSLTEALGIPDPDLDGVSFGYLPESVAAYVHEKLEMVCGGCPARQSGDMIDICLACPFERLGEIAASQRPKDGRYLDTKDRFIG